MSYQSKYENKLSQNSLSSFGREFDILSYMSSYISDVVVDSKKKYINSSYDKFRTAASFKYKKYLGKSTVPASEEARMKSLMNDYVDIHKKSCR